MATTLFRRDHLTRRIVDPTGTAKDYLGRVTTASVDYLGRPMVGTVWAATAVALGEYRQATTGVLYVCTVAGTAAAGDPTPPGYGATVVSNTATFRQVTTAAG